MLFSFSAINSSALSVKGIVYKHPNSKYFVHKNEMYTTKEYIKHSKTIGFNRVNIKILKSSGEFINPH